MRAHPIIIIVILAAGRGTRFGGSGKLSAPCGPKLLGQWALDAARGTDLQILWVGNENTPKFAGRYCEIVLNPVPELGLGTSLAIAAAAAQERNADAMLVMLADMPLIDTGLLQQLIELSAPAACLHQSGKPGVPALIPSEMFEALKSLSGDHGASQLLSSAPDLKCLKPASGILLDVDTPEQLAKAVERLQALKRLT